jgi:hypothetical protein
MITTVHGGFQRRYGKTFSPAYQAIPWFIGVTQTAPLHCCIAHLICSTSLMTFNRGSVKKTVQHPVRTEANREQTA